MEGNILNDEDSKINQPTEIKIELMNHQKTMVKKMLEIEETGEINIESANYINYLKELNAKNIRLNTNFGILGDKVGAGKTLTTISLISVSKKCKERKIFLGGSTYSNLDYDDISESLNSNLIIVPHKILPQWKDSFLKYSNIKLYTISLNKEIDKIIVKKSKKSKNYYDQEVIIDYEEINPEIINNYDVILISENMYKRFYKLYENFKWNRIFIDEADSIKLPRDMNAKFNFLWLITGTPKGLFYRRKIYFLEQLFKDTLIQRIQNSFIFKNNDEYINQSIKLPHPKRLKIKCITPRELSIIKNLIPPSILQMINAGNSEQAIKALNCNIDTSENIIQVVTKNLRDSIKNKNIELQAEKDKIYPETLKKEQEFKIKIIENNLLKLKTKIDDIQKKIYELNNDYCPICMDSFTNPIIVSCCNNCFCFDCLAVSLGSLHNNKCPYCRQLINKSDMHIINSKQGGEKNNKIEEKKNREIKEKMDVLIDLITNKPDGSFMIFANYMDTFSKIELKLKENNITYNILKGQSSAVAKFIDDFKNKKVRVLMLNAQYFGAGMNLQMTTDLIMYHRFNTELEEQIIGRAQRLGRTTPLNVYYLLHDNELNNIDDKFNFEDQGNVHYMDWLENNKNISEDNINDNVKIIKKNIGIEIDDLDVDIDLSNFKIIN